MKIFRNDILPLGKRFAAINLFGVLFVKRNVHIDPQLLNHEKIHSAQLKEFLYLPFYILYILEWILLIFRYKFDLYKAYRNISFEKEAYENDADFDYLLRRPRYAMWKKSPKHQ